MREGSWEIKFVLSSFEKGDEIRALFSQYLWPRPQQDTGNRIWKKREEKRGIKRMRDSSLSLWAVDKADATRRAAAITEGRIKRSNIGTERRRQAGVGLLERYDGFSLLLGTNGIEGPREPSGGTLATGALYVRAVQCVCMYKYYACAQYQSILDMYASGSDSWTGKEQLYVTTIPISQRRRASGGQGIS